MPGRTVGLQWKLLMVKADTAPFVLKHRPERAASGLYPQPTETCLPITWAMSCLPQRFTYTHTPFDRTPTPFTHTPAETVISMVINCAVPLRLMGRMSEGGDAGRGCVCQALGWVLLCKHSCVSSCSCVLICLGSFHTNILDCAFLYLHADSHIMLITMRDLYMRLFIFLFRVYKRFLIVWTFRQP